MKNSSDASDLPGGTFARPPDGIRVAFWKHHPVADQAASTLACATLDFHAEVPGDLVKLTPAGNYQVAGRGGEADWTGDALGRRTFSGRAIRTPSDWLLLDTELTALEREVIAAARLTRSGLPASTPLLATVFPPMTQALMLAGPQCLQEHLRSSPREVLTGLARLATGTHRLMEAYRQAEVEGIYLAAQHMSITALSRLDYCRYSQDSDRQTMEDCACFGSNILHIHGSQVHFDGVPQAGNWQVHYELGPDNPVPQAYRAACNRPAVLGLPCAVWGEPEGVGSLLQQLLVDFDQSSALLTAPCVVPLAIPNSSLGEWIARLRSH